MPRSRPNRPSVCSCAAPATSDGGENRPGSRSRPLPPPRGRVRSRARRSQPVYPRRRSAPALRGVDRLAAGRAAPPSAETPTRRRRRSSTWTTTSRSPASPLSRAATRSASSASGESSTAQTIVPTASPSRPSLSASIRRPHRPSVLLANFGVAGPPFDPEREGSPAEVGARISSAARRYARARTDSLRRARAASQTSFVSGTTSPMPSPARSLLMPAVPTGIVATLAAND